MPVETTYTQARAHLAHFLDRVVADRETVIITRPGAPSAALISAAELESLIETAHLLRSPNNAARLLKSLQRALKRRPRPRSLASLRREMGIDRR